LIVWQILTDLIKLFIILTFDSGRSFNVFFAQKSMHSCPFSYRQYKQVQQKLRVFSFSGFTSIVASVVIVSLVMNLFISPFNNAQAATFGWVQNASSTAIVVMATMVPASDQLELYGSSQNLECTSSIIATTDQVLYYSNH
jgi:hypothetical protein